jgi:hypothetical protein
MTASTRRTVVKNSPVAARVRERFAEQERQLVEAGTAIAVAWAARQDALALVTQRDAEFAAAVAVLAETKMPLTEIADLTGVPVANLRASRRPRTGTGTGGGGAVSEAEAQANLEADAAATQVQTDAPGEHMAVEPVDASAAPSVTPADATHPFTEDTTITTDQSMV